MDTIDNRGRVRTVWRAARPSTVVGTVTALLASLAVLIGLAAPAAGAPELPPGGLVASTPNFGGLEGSFSVTDDGAASYSVPLWVPEGRNGSQVKLSLSYNSRAGNGLLGMGWKLDGLSSITWCPRTRSLDGFSNNLFYDGSDALCLGGDRLLPLSSVPNPQQDYTTERAMFARITAFGTQDNVPDSFKVFAKDGTILTFGQTDDSRLQAFRLTGQPNGNVVRESTTRSTVAWAVNRIEDRNGNAATVEYARSEDNDNGLWAVDMRPSVIRYEPNRTVRFFYEDRFAFGPSSFNDVIDGFAGGVHTRMSSRLSRIVMSGGPAGGTAEPLREYRLAYQNTSITGRSQLHTVTDCDGHAAAGASDGACKTPLTFNWSQGTNEFTPIDLHDVTDAGTSPNGHGGNRILPIDIDGDGRSDILYTDADNNWKIRRTNGGVGLGGATDAGIPRAGTDTEALIKLVDFDLDGRTDAMVEVPDSSKGGTGWKLFRSDGVKYVPYADNIGFFGNDDDIPDQAHFVDLDGNGTPDFVTAVDEIKDTAPGLIDGPWRYRLNSGTEDGGRWGPERTVEGGAQFFPQNSLKLAVIDPDGDGRQELIGFNADKQPRSLGLNALNGDESIPTNLRGDDPLLGDFNGDGLTDGQFQVLVGSPHVGQTNTGNGVQGFSGDGISTPGRVADFNDDGRDDVLTFPSTCAQDCHGSLWLSGASLSQSVDVGDTVNGNGFAPVQPLDINGDGLEDLVNVQDFPGGHGFLRLLLHTGVAPDLLGSFDPGKGVGPEVEVVYTSMSDRNVHTPCTGATYPQTCPTQGGAVVELHQIATGVPAEPWDRYNHSYVGGRADLLGRGWLGFAEHTVRRALTGAVTTTTFDNVTRDATRRTYPFAQLPKQTTATVKVTASLFDRTQTNTTYQLRPIGLGYLVAPQTIDAVESERTGTTGTFQQLRKISVGYDYDDFGNVTTTSTAIDGGRTTSATRQYDNLTGDWLIGKLRGETTIGCTPASQCEIRHNTFDYYPNGNLKTSVVEPDRPDLKLTTTTVYGDAGTIKSKTVADAAGHSRATSFDYDGDLLHATATVDALGHRSTTDYHRGLGLPIHTTGLNPGEQATMRYDGFGRLRETNHADGSFQHITHTAGDTQTVTTTDAGGGLTATVTDTLGRKAQEQVRAFDGQLATTHTTYDTLGRVASVSRPAVGDPSPFTTTYTYDARDRPLTQRAPDGATIRHAYTGLRTDTTDARGTQSFTVATVNGDVGSSCQDDPNADDPLCTTFEYDPFGNTSKITAADGTAQKMHYDAAGRRDSMVDPSLGTVVTHYDAFGEPSDQTNGAGQTSAYTYDALGRMTRIDSLDGATTLIWDTSPHGVGKLAGALSPDKVLTSYQYDELGHQTVTSSQLDKDVFEVVTGYDDIGRPDTVTYPEVSVPGGSTRLRVKNVYNANGYLSQVKDAATGGPVYWTAQQRNAAGQLTQEVQGNGVVSDYTYRPDTGLLDKINVEKLRQISYDYDANRNITVRNDQTDGRYEAYGYDTLNRLDRWQARPSATGEPVLTSDYQYDRVGGLKTETTTQTGQPTQTTTYEYGYEHPELSAPAHALVKRNAAEYTYDNAGRQVTGPNRSIGYTAFDLPRTFDAMATTQDATPLHVDFRYDATGARLLKRDAGGSTFTAGDLFERRVPAGPSKAQVHNLNNVVANGRIVAQVDFVQATAGGAATTKVQYLHADQQGSTILVTGSKGTADGGDESIFNNLFYDPWGRRIDDNYQQIPKTLTDGPRQLYTGQYHDDEMSLINMKGRVYDPQARRFLTPDPILTEPLNTQSDDRYTYVRDNPTTMTDPTGHIGGADGGGGVDIFFCCGADAWNSAMDWIDGGGFDDLSPSPLDAPLITQTSTMASMLSVGNGAAGGADGLAAEDSVCRLEEETTCALPDDPAVSTAQDPVNRSDMSDSDSAGDQGDADDDEDDRGQNCDGCVIGAKGGKQNVRDTGLRDLSPEELQARYRAATGKEKQRLLKELKGRGLRHRAGADQRRPNRPQEQEQPAEEAQPEAQQPEQQPEQQPNEGQRPGTPDPVQERNGITAGEVGTAAGVAAGGLTVGGIIWWVLKVASPLCGPAAPACAVVL